MIVEVARKKDKKNKAGEGGNQGERVNLLTYLLPDAESFLRG